MNDRNSSSRRSPGAGTSLSPALLTALHAVHGALAEGNYGRAFDVLADVAGRRTTRSEAAAVQLQMAALDALYGADGLDKGLESLHEAATIDPSCVRSDLYRALHWEFRAMQGARERDVRKGIEAIDETVDPVAAFHAASAAWRAGATRTAMRRLGSLEPGTLPPHLAWRYGALVGHVHADEFEFEAAADGYRRAFAGAVGVDKEPVRVQYASVLLELGRSHDAAALLDERDDTVLDPADVAWAAELAGRADVEAGNPVRGLVRLEHAERIAVDDEQRHAAVQAQGQALSRLGRFEEAARRLQRVVEAASGETLSYALHEQGIAFLEADLLHEAEAALRRVTLDPDYPHLADATADLADVLLRMGDVRLAEDAARRALDLGATASASLIMGSAALEYYDLDEAVGWLERSLADAREGDATWTAALQTLADVLAQIGPREAHRLSEHARRALEYVEPGSEASAVLESYVQRARAWMHGHDRLLN